MARAHELEVNTITPAPESAALSYAFRGVIVGSDVPNGVLDWYYEVKWDPDTETTQVFLARRAEALRAKAAEIGVTIPPNRAYLIAFSPA